VHDDRLYVGRGALTALPADARISAPYAGLARALGTAGNVDKSSGLNPRLAKSPDIAFALEQDAHVHAVRFRHRDFRGFLDLQLTCQRPSQWADNSASTWSTVSSVR
jgi:hypothetical protein